MKFTIMGFNQKQAIAMNLDLTDLMLLNWLKDFYHAMEKTIVNNQQYAWVNYQYILDDIPIIGIESKRSLARRFDKLCEKKLVKKHVTNTKNQIKGTYTYFAVNEETINLLSNKVGVDSEVQQGCTLESNTGGLESTTGVDLKVQPKINLLEDTPTKDTLSNKEKKVALGEFGNVYLTEEEIEKLFIVYNESYEDFKRAIDILDEYIENHARGKKYKSHYAVMRTTGWVYNRTYEKTKPVPIKRGELY